MFAWVIPPSGFDKLTDFQQLHFLLKIKEIKHYNIFVNSNRVLVENEFKALSLEISSLKSLEKLQMTVSLNNFVSLGHFEQILTGLINLRHLEITIESGAPFYGPKDFFLHFPFDQMKNLNFLRIVILLSEDSISHLTKNLFKLEKLKSLQLLGHSLSKGSTDVIKRLIQSIVAMKELKEVMIERKTRIMDLGVCMRYAQDPDPESACLKYSIIKDWNKEIDSLWF